MRIYFNELSEDPKELNFTGKEPWVKEVLEAVEESHSKESRPQMKLDFELHKSQDLVFLKSRINIEIGLLCSRCLQHIDHHLKGEFQSLYTRQKGMENPNESQNHGIAYSAQTGSTGEELDIQCVEKDYIELKDVLQEQIYLQLPYQPLCKEDCKGICPVCGQDQNTQPCQCHRIKNTALANALKNIRLPQR